MSDWLYGTADDDRALHIRFGLFIALLLMLVPPAQAFFESKIFARLERLSDADEAVDYAFSDDDLVSEEELRE